MYLLLYIVVNCKYIVCLKWEWFDIPNYFSKRTTMVSGCILLLLKQVSTNLPKSNKGGKDKVAHVKHLKKILNGVYIGNL